MNGESSNENQRLVCLCSEEKKAARQSMVWCVIVLFGVLIVDFVGIISLNYYSEEQNGINRRLLIVQVYKLFLLVTFIILWNTKLFKKIKSKLKKSIFLSLFTLSLAIGIVEEILSKQLETEHCNQSEGLFIGSAEISILIFCFSRFSSHIKLSFLTNLLIALYIIGRLISYSSLQSLFSVIQLVILFTFIIHRFYYYPKMKDSSSQQSNIQNVSQPINHKKVQILSQQHSVNNSQNNQYYSSDPLITQQLPQFKNNHQKSNVKHQPQASKNDQSIKFFAGDQNISQLGKKGHSFSFDLGSQEGVTLHHTQFPSLKKSDKYIDNIDLDASAVRMILPDTNRIESSAKKNSRPIISYQISRENTKRATGEFLKHESTGIIQNLILDKQASLSHIDSQQQENYKKQGSKIYSGETLNLVNFYNMFFNILPEGIAIIPLSSETHKMEEIQINQTLNSLLQCDSKEKCLSILLEMRNSKLEEQLAQQIQSQVSQVNHSIQHFGTNSEFIPGIANSHRIEGSGIQWVGSQVEVKRKEEKETIAECENSKEQESIDDKNQSRIYQDSKREDKEQDNQCDNSMDSEEKRENYFNEKTRRITFMVDYKNIKKNKNNSSVSEIVLQSRNLSQEDESRNSRFFSCPKEQEPFICEQSEHNGVSLLQPSKYQVELVGNIGNFLLSQLCSFQKQNQSLKLTVSKEIEHIKKQLENLKLFESYEMIGVQVRMVSKCKLENNKVKYFEIIFIPCVINSEITVVLVLKDITHFNEIEVLKNVNENKSQMMSQVAHEIRTPLNCVISMLEITKDLTDTSINEKYLAPALTSARLLNNLIQDLLDMAQMKAGCFQLKFTRFNIRNLLEEVKQLMQVQTKGSSVEMKVECNEQVPIFIHSDPFRIRQIIINLVGNALKFTQKGYITVLAEKYQNAENIVKIAVKDTGIGIQPKQKQKLFQAFGKLEDDHQDLLNPKGVGLGLMISNELAKKLSAPLFTNKGLEVFSQYGEGSEFSFVILENIQNYSSIVPLTLNSTKEAKSDKILFSKKNQTNNANSPQKIQEGNNSTKNAIQSQYQDQNNAYDQKNSIKQANSKQTFTNVNCSFAHQCQSLSPPKKVAFSFKEAVNSGNISGYGSDKPVSPNKIFNGIINHGKKEFEFSIKSIENQIDDQEEENIADGFLSFQHQLPTQIKSTTHAHRKNTFDSAPLQSQKSDRSINNNVLMSNGQYILKNQTDNRRCSIQELHPQNQTQNSQHFNKLSSFSSSKERNLTLSANSPNSKMISPNSKKMNYLGYTNEGCQFFNVGNPLLDTTELLSSREEIKDHLSEQKTIDQKINGNINFKENHKITQKCNCPLVLVVDDNNFNIYVLKQLLTTIKKIECDSALSGDQAICSIEARMKSKCCDKYSLIFMDIDMPMQNGIETTTFIRSKFENLKSTVIVGCSGFSTSSEEYIQCMKSGMNDYLGKPIERNKLKSILDQYLPS